MRKQYDPKLRAKAVELYRQGATVQDVARLLAIPKETVWYWIRRAGAQRGKRRISKAPGVPLDDLQALERLAERYAETLPLHRRLAMTRYLAVAVRAQKVADEFLSRIEQALSGELPPAEALAWAEVMAQVMRAVDNTYRTIRLALGQATDLQRVEVVSDEGGPVKVELPQDEIVEVQPIEVEPTEGGGA
jgi:transposase-like protein